jgi:hypothetical protein
MVASLYLYRNVAQRDDALLYIHTGRSIDRIHVCRWALVLDWIALSRLLLARQDEASTQDIGCTVSELGSVHSARVWINMLPPSPEYYITDRHHGLTAANLLYTRSPRLCLLRLYMYVRRASSVLLNTCTVAFRK